MALLCRAVELDSVGEGCAVSTHAPGPWSRDKYGTVVDANGHTILVSGVGLAGGRNRDDKDEVFANTQLLAAALDLLEALKGLVMVNEAWNRAVDGIVGKPPTWSDSYLDAARAAIAKATGEGA